jgi:hypothetical protein
MRERQCCASPADAVVAAAPQQAPGQPTGNVIPGVSGQPAGNVAQNADEGPPPRPQLLPSSGRIKMSLVDTTYLPETS